MFKLALHFNAYIGACPGKFEKHHRGTDLLTLCRACFEYFLHCSQSLVTFSQRPLSQSRMFFFVLARFSWLTGGRRRGERGKGEDDSRGGVGRKVREGGRRGVQRQGEGKVDRGRYKCR